MPAMFWDGSRWVAQSDGSERNHRRRSPKRASADWPATLSIVILAALLVVPFLATSAATATLTAAGTASPGGSITVKGSNFGNRERIQLAWDGAPQGKAFTVGSAFTSTFVIPAGTNAGDHELSAVRAKARPGSSA